MFFSFKKKKIVVDCFTYDEAAYKMYPIRKAISYYPEEIKKMPMTIPSPDPQSNVDIPLATMKSCTGINGLYKRGIIIPFWTDLIVQPKKALVERRSKLYKAGQNVENRVHEHPRLQYQGMFEDFVNLKISNVWAITEKQGIKFLVLPALYNLNNYANNFIVPHALTYYDLQAQTNLQLFIRKESPDFTILAGTPMQHVIPLIEEDREIEYKTHLITMQEWGKKGDIPGSFPELGTGYRNPRYRKLMKDKERMDAEETKGKCPFGFGK